MHEMIANSIFYIIVVLLLIRYWWLRPKYVPVQINGRTWNVISTYPNYMQAAQLLASVHANMLLFMKYLINKFGIDQIPQPVPSTPAGKDMFTIAQTLVKNYNPDEFYENDPRTSSDTSFTRDKGLAMYICMRRRNNPNILVSEDMLFFVILHEMAHIGNYDGWGHKSRFWQVFKFLLQQAEASGIYAPVNYALTPQWYCGLNVAYNPLYDVNVPNIDLSVTA